MGRRAELAGQAGPFLPGLESPAANATKRLTTASVATATNKGEIRRVLDGLDRLGVRPDVLTGVILEGRLDVQQALTRYNSTRGARPLTNPAARPLVEQLLGHVYARLDEHKTANADFRARAPVRHAEWLADRVQELKAAGAKAALRNVIAADADTFAAWLKLHHHGHGKPDLRAAAMAFAMHKFPNAFGMLTNGL